MVRGTRVILDTNVLLDIAVPGRPDQDAASTLFRLVCDDDLWAEISASSLKDFYHITRRTIPEGLLAHLDGDGTCR